MLDKYGYLVYVLPLMASLVKKKKGNRLYYYLVESARVDGKPRIVHQAYLGTAEKLAELVQQNTAPVPLSATLRNFGLPGALWLSAKQSGLWPLLESLWPAPRSGPGPERGAGHRDSSSGHKPDCFADSHKAPGRPKLRKVAERGTGAVFCWTSSASFSAVPR